MKQPEYHAAIADWSENGDDIKRIRQSVFIDEQHVPEELEWDGLDQHCTQFLAWRDSQAIATARLKADGQIGRMAVLREHRRRGAGSILLDTILGYAAQAGHDRVYLHAQVSAVDFYLKHGFVIEGDEFLDAGIPHRAMFKISAK